MSVLDHWHPVLGSKEVRDKPAGIRLDGRELVVFRGASGRLGCLEDTCPHRRMRLSLGNVVNDYLRCRYHGWTYDCEGNGTSPGTPRLHARAVHFDTREAHGAIWVKSAQSSPKFPRFDTAGFYHLGNLSYIADAPLELVLDNITENEHTPTTHRLFGYDLECLEQVDVQVEPADTEVRTLTDGPTRRLPLPVRLSLGIRNDFHFHGEWTVFFSPVYAVFDHYWKHPATGREGKMRWRAYAFLVPLDPVRTLIQVFAYMKSAYPGPMAA
jgi:phenylpropionate dioxygenase-like ring-hydroxylating dioxygenase large terminal subunit